MRIAESCEEFKNNTKLNLHQDWTFVYSSCNIAYRLTSALSKQYLFFCSLNTLLYD